MGVLLEEKSIIAPPSRGETPINIVERRTTREKISNE